MSTFFKIRKLKISSKFCRALWKKHTRKPKLILSGDWLQKAGFDIGENVTITVNKNQLIITKI